MLFIQTCTFVMISCIDTNTTLLKLNSLTDYIAFLNRYASNSFRVVTGQLKLKSNKTRYNQEISFILRIRTF